MLCIPQLEQGRCGRKDYVDAFEDGDRQIRSMTLLLHEGYPYNSCYY